MLQNGTLHFAVRLG